MRYNDLIIEARRNGVWDDAAMEKSVKSVDGLLQYVKDVNKEVYWAFMRQQSGILYGHHYNETFATYDVGQMCGTDKDGNTRRGAYWSVAKIEDAMRGSLDDSQILVAAYNFYFADEDCDDTSTKI